MKSGLSSAGETMFALVLSRDGRLPADDALVRAIHRHIPEAAVPPDAVGGSAALFFADDAMVALGMVDAPAPIAKDDPCVLFSWHWPAAWKEVERHTAHVMVSVTGGVSAKKRARLLGRAVAAVIEATPEPCAIHWASSDALWPVPLVVEAVAKAGDGPPILLCVAVKLSRDADGGVSAVTSGLTAFGLMEIETRGFRGDPRALNGFVLDLAGYLIDAGDVIADGDTIGLDAATKVAVRREASSLFSGQSVYRLYF